MSAAPDHLWSVPPILLHDLPRRAAGCCPDAIALRAGEACWTYGRLQSRIEAWAHTLRSAGLPAGARVAVLVDKLPETVAVCFAVSRAGGVLVPLNPLLKPAQALHVIQDAGAWALVALSPPSVSAWLSAWPAPAPCRVMGPDTTPDATPDATPAAHADPVADPSVVDTDLAAIFYTSGSTGRAKGVMVSHRNLVAGAGSVVRYLGNRADDVLLAALPLSFDAGFSQLTTAFMVGAQVVLHHHVLPRDTLSVMQRHGVTGLTAVPPLLTQLLAQPWPSGAADRLRYWACTGGRVSSSLLTAMQGAAPQALPYLMYGLTEAFRSTYLPPDQVGRRPDSMGKAIPNVEVLVLRPDGSPCNPGEVGQLVHRGPLVALGYWNNPQATAERFGLWSPSGRPDLGERVVFSGDLVRQDAEGYLYFVARGDDLIKTSGYRVSPTEVEEVVLSCEVVAEAIALGHPDDALGSVVRVVATRRPQAPVDDAACTDMLMRHCRRHLPGYMVPRLVEWVSALPRNPNGKIDRQRWRLDDVA